MGDEQLQVNISDLRERVARMEVKVEGVEIALQKFDAHLGLMGARNVSTTMRQPVVEIRL